MSFSQRLKEIDWIGVALWIFRAVIIILVIVGTVRKLFFGVGTQYTLDDWTDFVVSGLSQGSLYALIALGYTMVYGVLFMINFAHGEFFMSGAMTSTVLLATTLAAGGFMDKQPVIYLVTVTILSVVTAMGVALLTERVAYRPLRRAPRLVPLITAIGASFFWQYIFRGLFGSSIIPFPVPEVLEGRFSVLGIEVLKTRAVVFVVAAVSMLGLYFFVMRTRTGKAIRAVAEDKDVAALMGIDVDRSIAMTFAIGAAMAGIAAVLWALVFKQVNFFMGFVPGIKAFTAAVLGGIGSIPGAAIGGLLLGLIEAVGPPLFWKGWAYPALTSSRTSSPLRYWSSSLIFRPGVLSANRSRKKKHKEAGMTATLDWQQTVQLGLLAGVITLVTCAIGMVEAFDERDLIVDILTLGQVLLFGSPFIVGYLVVADQEHPAPLPSLLNGLVAGALTHTTGAACPPGNLLDNDSGLFRQCISASNRNFDLWSGAIGRQSHPDSCDGCTWIGQGRAAPDSGTFPQSTHHRIADYVGYRIVL
ncbi:MAG: branched-chain amino acid ABC transporter permease [Chloroflexota bacterium]